MRAAAAGAVLICAAAWMAAVGAPGGTPLWPGAKYTVQQRDRAIHRGMDFLYNQVARNPKDFADWGHDLLGAFDNIAETSLNPDLRREALNMGRERAREWR